MKITEYLKEHILFLDGGMGTLLQKKGLTPGTLPERWNIDKPDVITAIHRDYFDAGSHVVNTNTFGANLLKFSKEELDAVIGAAINNAKKAMTESRSSQPKWIALDIGPTGRLLKPYGDFDFEDAVAVFAETVKIGVKYGADLIFIETMNDSYETKAALLAAKENCTLPVFVSNAYGEDGKLMTGATPAAMVALLEGMGADAIGVNCSFGPNELSGVVEEYLKYSSLPILVKPNAGLPQSIDGETVFDVDADKFSIALHALTELGVHAVGGCCGTTPLYIEKLVKKLSSTKPKPVTHKNFTVVSSYTHAVTFGEYPILIGERINPTGKKLFKEALRAKDMDYILKEAIAQEEKGVDILDVNVGLPEIDETEMLTNTVCELQAILNLPLQIDTSDFTAMESALRRYNGKAMINSVNGKKESMSAVFPLARKYGGLVVALTLDESGIPQQAEQRVQIAKNILETAKSYGIDKKDIIFDPLALTISADGEAAKETLRAVHMIKSELGCHVSLGVSNVSFGLPSRDIINGTFFSLALGQGLSAAIMNPYSAEMMKNYYAFCALSGLDNNCEKFISFAETVASSSTVSAQPLQNQQKSSTERRTELQTCIIKGLKERAATVTLSLLNTIPPLSVIQNEIIPALNVVGVGFEKKSMYLPQLLMSAEAAKSAFEVIKEKMPGQTKEVGSRFVLATVKGDIHDIGKNIVKLLLENYGFAVTDLGRDVPPEKIVEAVKETHANLVGLSALMTTTVPSMQETIRLLRTEAPWCKIIVGGAVLTQEYADAIGADCYAKDAMGAVRYAEKINFQ